jgi:hypothetical protein
MNLMLPYILSLSPALLEVGAGDFHKTLSNDCEFLQNLLREDHTFRIGLNEITSHMQQNFRALYQ